MTAVYYPADDSLTIYLKPTTPFNTADWASDAITLTNIPGTGTHTAEVDPKKNYFAYVMAGDGPAITDSADGPDGMIPKATADVNVIEVLGETALSNSAVAKESSVQTVLAAVEDTEEDMVAF